MPFCANCGTQVAAEMKFCPECGTSTEVSPAQHANGVFADAGQTIHSQPVPDTSRLSRSGVEKFLSPGEMVIYVTPGRIRYGDQRRHAYVTNQRVIFYGKKGAMLGLVKQDRLDEVFLNQIRRFKLVETGLIAKRVFLELDEMKLDGRRRDLLDLYKAIQSARASVGVETK